MPSGLGMSLLEEKRSCPLTDLVVDVLQIGLAVMMVVKLSNSLIE